MMKVEGTEYLIHHGWFSKHDRNGQLLAELKASKSSGVPRIRDVTVASMDALLKLVYVT